MNLQEYRNKYATLKQNIENAENEFKSFKLGEKFRFNELYQEERSQNLQKFIENFDYIWKHREYIKQSKILSKIVIDFLKLYDYGGLVSGAGFCYGKGNFKIYLGDLLDLWENGFTYNNYPILEYTASIHYTTRHTIKYLENGEIKIEKRETNHPFSYLEGLDRDFMKKVCQFNITDKYPDMETYSNISNFWKYIKQE